MKHTHLSKILSVLLSLCVLLCMVPFMGLSVSALDATLDTDGTTILISTAEQLAAIGVDENYPLDGSYKLANDIDLSSYETWTPIAPYNGGGNVGQPDQEKGVPSATYFSGTLDGDGHTIYGMNVSVTEGRAHAGLFGIMNNATVKNLIVKEASVTAHGSYVSHGGIIAGATSSTTTVFENIAVYDSKVYVTNKHDNDRNAAGGLVGWGANGTTVKGCFVDADVTVAYNAESGESKQSFASGLVGLAWNGYTTASDSLFVGTLTNNYYIPADDFTPTAAYNHKSGVVASTGTTVNGSQKNCYHLDTSGVNTEFTTAINGGEIKAAELENASRAALKLSGEYWRDGVGYPTLIFTLPKTDAIYPDYIPIYSAVQLAKIGKDDAYPLSGKYILMNDIDMSDYGNWTPIGNLNDTNLNIGWIGRTDKDEAFVTAAEKVFTGTFDGGGHTISNMTVSYSANRPYAGLFGILHTATVQNIIFDNANVTSTGKSTSEAGIVAGATSTTSTLIQNVLVRDSVVTANNSKVDEHAAAGGLVGYGFEGTTVKNCYVDADLTSNFTVENSFSKQMYVSGFVGLSYNCLAKVYDSVFVGTLTNNYHNYNDGTEKDLSYNFTAGVSMSTNANLRGVASNVYYIDTAGVNTAETSKKMQNGTAISADALKTATADSMGFDKYYWANDGEGLYLAVTPSNMNADGAIEIDTARKLAAIGVLSNYPRIGNYVLTADIDLSTYGNWTPICGEGRTQSSATIATYGFKGIFDGQGHTISGMTITQDTKFATAGLFGMVHDSNDTGYTAIKNIVFKDCHVDAKGSFDVYAGIVVGNLNVDDYNWVHMDNIAIIDCSVNGVTTAANGSGVGSIAGTAHGLQMTNIYSNATLSGGCTVANDKFAIGGITGSAYFGRSWTKGAIFNGTIENNNNAESTYVNTAAFLGLNGNHSESNPTPVSGCNNSYYNSDKLTPSTATNGGEYNGTAKTTFELGISPISTLGLASDYWMHNGTTPMLKIAGDDEYVTGDANGDGKQDILDLIRIKKYMAKATDEIVPIAIDLKRDQTIDVSDMAYLRKALLGINNAVTVELFSAAEDVKYLGAVYTENNRLIMARENTGYELSVMAEGDITTTLTASLGDWPYAKLAVTVDGVTEIIKVYPGTATYTLAGDLDYGAHTVKVLKITEYTKGSIYAKDVAFNGTLNARPADSELSIDFYGDSITAGDGVVATDRTSNEGYLEGQFSNKTYAAQTAELLGADMRAIAQSGLQTVNAVKNLSLGGSAKWGYNADVVVINLGTNDWSVISEKTDAATEAGIAAEVAAINAVLDAVTTCYGADVKIVWCYGSMGSSKGYENIIADAVNAYAANNANVSYCSLMAAANNAGGSGHPTEAGHAAAAAILSAHIKSVLAAE